MKGLVKEHICINHGHRQQCGDSQREWGGGWWLGGGTQGWVGNGDICNSINNKNKEKKLT